MKHPASLALCALACAVATFAAEAQTPPTLKTETFDLDPGWEGHQNRVVPTEIKKVTQDFGYRATHFAGKQAGEIGGRVHRSPARASYAVPIPVKTLTDKLAASGTFAITASAGSSGAFFGFFDSGLPGERQSTLGFHFAGQGKGARLTLRLVTGRNQACGTKVTPWEGKYQPPSIKNDGTRYTWTLDYDPAAADGRGQMRFVIRSNSAQPDTAFEGKTFTVDLPAGYKEHGTKFDRFGLMNSMKAGNPMTIHFDDLQFDGKTEDFSRDPQWQGSVNQVTLEEREQSGAHDFGFSAKSNFAGGTAGEAGGIMWRTGDYAYYADRVARLTLEDRLVASGKVVLNVGAPDSGMHVGWFQSNEKEEAPNHAGNFLGISVGGPSRVGHYFVPAYAPFAEGIEHKEGKQHPENRALKPQQGPVLVPGKVFEWTLAYDPAGNKGTGALTLTMAGQTVTLNVKPGHKAQQKTAGAFFDRFGLFTTHVGGGVVKIYFDDLTYTASPAP